MRHGDKRVLMAGRWQNAVVGACRWQRCVALAAPRMWLLPAGLALGVLAGCASTPRQTSLSPTPEVSTPADSGTLDQYATAIKANSDRSDRESDGKVRADLAAQSSSMADHCLALNAQAAPCQYAKALATGMEARRILPRRFGCSEHVE